MVAKRLLPSSFQDRFDASRRVRIDLNDHSLGDVVTIAIDCMLQVRIQLPRARFVRGCREAVSPGRKPRQRDSEDRESTASKGATPQW